jgi:hypothetical protein
MAAVKSSLSVSPLYQPYRYYPIISVIGMADTHNYCYDETHMKMTSYITVKTIMHDSTSVIEYVWKDLKIN